MARGFQDPIGTFSKLDNQSCSFKNRFGHPKVIGGNSKKSNKNKIQKTKTNSKNRNKKRTNKNKKVKRGGSQ